VSLREDNLAVLASLHPWAAASLSAAPPEPGRVYISPSAAGPPTAVLDGRRVHSGHDPVREARRQVQGEVPADATAVIALGFGLGYGVEAVRELRPGVPIIAIEPEAALFNAALGSRDLRPLLSDPRLRVHLDREPEGLAGLLEGLPLSRPCFLRLRPAIQARPAPYRAAEELVRSWLLRRDINVNTLKRFGRLWVRNLCRNVRAFADCAGVAGLSGLFDGLPGLVVAGGPSLDALGPRLRELRERAFVVAVNTPLAACMAWGAEPDFTVVVDPQYWASRYLDWAQARRCIYVAEPSTCPRLFRAVSSPVFLCSSLFPLGETLEAAIGEKGKLGAGGSVSTSAWDFARLLGARPLYAAGLDLGFPGLRTHCRGVFAEQSWLAAATRLDPLEGRSHRAITDIGLFGARAAGGGLVPTDRRMLLYKWWFECQLAMRPEVDARTLSPDGVDIKGMRVSPVEEALGLPRIRPEVDRRLERARAIHRDTARDARLLQALADAVADIGSQMEALESLGTRGAALCGELEAAVAAGADPRPLIAALDDVDARILSLPARGVAGFLLQSIIHEITGQGEAPADPREAVARSKAVYAEMAESTAWQKDLLRRAAEALA
jgi:hypothetical protein